MIALYIALIILALILLIMLIPVDCIIDLSYNNEENRGSIIIRYAFLKFKIFPSEAKKEAKEAEEEIEKDAEKNTRATFMLIREVYSQLRGDILNVISHALGHTIRIKVLNISAKFGTGNPMYTGIATGMVNSAVYNMLSVIDRKMKLDKHSVSLDADFDNLCLSAGVYCKVRTRIAYVLKIGIMAAVVLLKILKINRRIKKNGR